LGLEAKLKSIRPIYDEIPTLPPGTEWESDPSFGKYVYKDKNANVTAKTKKTFDFKILTPATDKHPAQIEKWNIDVPVGYFTKTRWSSCLSVAQKSALLARLDKLAQAIKQARQRANGQEVDTKSKIGSKLFEYLHKDIL
jgi:hypothetical protein